MILRAGVAEMGSGGGGADGCHMAITSSQRCHVQHISIAFNYLSFPMLIPQYLGTITSRSQANLPAVKQNIHTETEAQTKTSPFCLTFEIGILLSITSSMRCRYVAWESEQATHCSIPGTRN